MESITFSRRLYSLPGILVVLVLNIAYSVQGLRHIQTGGTPQGTALMLVGLILFALVGTLGWRYCLRQGSVSWMRVYFIFQVALFIALFWLENADTRTGSAIGSLAITPILQSAVMRVRIRVLIYGVMIASMILISALYLPVTQLVFPTIVLLLTNGAILLIGYLIMSEERAHELLNETNRKLTEYAAQVEELAISKERNRLAREIHDSIGHYLTAINMQIEAARAIMESDPARAQQALGKAQTLTKDGLAEIRRSVSALRVNPTDNRPLHEAIELLVEEHRASGLDVSYQIEGTIRPVSAQVEITLYRIAQEGLTNIRKHAQATHADLILKYLDEQRVYLKINDNGSGSAAKGTGFGLLGIQERLKAIGGTLNIQTGKGQGFTLQAEIPT